MPNYTQPQQNVISYRGKNMLVSASAGTGKTTVMIERIASLIEEGADVSSLAVVTFTNLAAAEMKKRLFDKLSEKRGNRHVVEQLEKLDNASICTIHSFCSELLRSYFYVADIDPNFAILDSTTVAALRKSALDETFKEYFKSKDELFGKVYKIFATGRREENFKNTLLSLYDFSRCLEDFNGWYAQKRENFLTLGEDNVVVATLLDDIRQNVQYFKNSMDALAKDSGERSLQAFADIFVHNAERLAALDVSNLQSALFSVSKFGLTTLPKRNSKKDLYGVPKEEEERVRADFEGLNAEWKSYKNKYSKLCNNKSVEELWEETRDSVQYADKLVEILQRFHESFAAQKKQRGGVDFNDLEHMTLVLLNDEETAKAICERYKLVFVDEYQDTNPVQEAIVSRLAAKSDLFVVGDVKQGIYGFRGCDSTIFLNKYRSFKSGKDGSVEELNTNFRSNNEILNFVNIVFNSIMTEGFGKVDYRGVSQLDGTTPPSLKTPSVQIDLIVKQKIEERELSEIYDLTAPRSDGAETTQGEVIAQKIARFVGMAYKDKNGNSRRIGYGDIVVLMRGLKDKALAVYNTLVEHNIPVAASFKMAGYANKEVRDLINLLRVLDNPYNDIYLVGTCLTPFGKLTESELAEVKTATQDQRVPFLERMQMYVSSAKNNSITTKIDSLLAFLEQLRFYACSATVDEIVLRVLQETSFHLYVQGLPNGALRLRKLYGFVDGLKGASYAQSVDKFLSYLDETDDFVAEEGMSDTNAVRMMTMHASKGLEFPVVIVAGLESVFVVDHPSVERNAELGLATRYYDFSTMKTANTLGVAACGMFNRTKQQEEEMRLLYVALTRAKYSLCLVGTLSENQLSAMPKRSTAANSHLDWLLTAIKSTYGSLAAAKDVAQINIVYEVEDCEAQETENLLCEQIHDGESVLKQLDYRYPFAHQQEMPSKIVSSALDREFIDSDAERADFVLAENNDRNFVGTAYHKVYQFVDIDATEEEIQQAIDGLVREGKIEPQYARQVQPKVIWNTLNNAELRELLSRGKAYHEMPFMLLAPYDGIAVDQRFSDEVMLQGVIDLLILRDDSATVVDFKYSTHSEELLKKSYRAQLNSYRLAVQKICDIQKVDCYIMSIESNKLVKM